MRTKNEKFLLAVLIAILVVAGNYYGYQWLAKKQKTLNATYMDLHADQLEAEIALRQQDVWIQRKKWIADHEPLLGDEENAKAQVLEAVVKGAHDNKLEIMEQSLGDSQTGPAGTKINVTIKVKGPMDGLCHWVADLQKPENFYAVALFSLKADSDQKSMVCSLQLVRYFRGGS